MQVNYAYKFYIKPNKQQRQLLEHHFGCNRFVWNYFLHQRQTFYQTNKEDIEAKRNKGNCSYYNDANELVARVSAVLRRSGTSKSEDPMVMNESTDFKHTGDFIEYDNLIVNISNYTVTFEGKNIDMPPKELELLYFIASHPNQVFTRDQLLNQLWGYDFVGDTRTVDVHIKRLREKLGSKYNWSIQTVYRIGYKFEVK